MTIALTPEQQRMLEEAVASGRFASVQEALDVALVTLVTTDEADDAWVKPLLDRHAGISQRAKPSRSKNSRLVLHGAGSGQVEHGRGHIFLTCRL